MSERQTPRVEGQEWTPEGWRVDEALASPDNGCRLTIVRPWGSECRPVSSETFGDYRGASICNLDFNGGVPTKAKALANARRIVSCVNSLAGTPIPDDVEPGAITRELERLRAVAEAAIAFQAAVADDNRTHGWYLQVSAEDADFDDAAISEAWTEWRAAADVRLAAQKRLDAALTTAGYLATDTEGT